MKVLIVLALVAAALAYEVDYTGYQVYSVTPSNKAELDYLVSLHDRLDLDFWVRSGHVGKAADIMAAPGVVEELMGDFKSRGIQFSIMHSDVQEAIDWETKMHNKIVKENQLKGEAFPFNQYHSTDELHAYMDELASQYTEVSTKVLGQSVEGRDLKLLMIGDGTKPVMFYDCQVHAREWIAAALCSWVANEVLTGSTGLKDKFDFAMVFPSNVDGYEFTRTSDRMWRKNRAHNSGSSCRGVDPNRNFDTHHCGEGSSTNPCSDVYCGPSPFSEPMTSVLRDNIKSYSTVAFAYSLHSYSQLILSPFGYTYDYPSDYSEMKASMDAASDALTATHGKRYQHGATAETIYVASGGSSDWYHDGAGVTHSYTYECRPTQGGGGGFILDESEIIPNSEEVFAGMTAAANLYIKEHNL